MADDVVVRSWRVEEGVPDNVVNQLIADRDGFIWEADEAGLSRFDGTRFRSFPLAASLPNGNYNIRALALDHDASLMALPASGGLVRFRAGAYSPHPLSEWLAARSLVALFIAPAGDVWIGTAEGEIIHAAGGHTETYPAVAVSARFDRFSFAVDRRGATWIGTNHFLGRYTGGKVSAVPAPGRNFVVAPSGGGGVWVASSGGLQRWDGTALRTVRTGNQWLTPGGGDVQCLLEDRGGALWIGTRRIGLYRLTPGGGMTRIPAQIPWISSLLQDRDGDLWFSSRGGGMGEIIPKTFRLLDSSAGLAADSSSSICQDAAGDLWCANREGGIAVYRHGTVIRIPSPVIGREWYANAVCADAAGVVWVGASDGLYCIRPGAHPLPEAVNRNLTNVTTLFSARSGDMWAGGNNGECGFYRDGIFHRVSGAQAGTIGHPVCIAEDVEGTIWLAVDGGLTEVQQGRVINRFPSETFAAGNIHTIYVGGPRELWLGSDRGLVLWRGGAARRFRPDEGVRDELITQIVGDDQGEIWIGGRLGYFHASRQQLLAVADGRAPKVEGVLFGKDDGLPAASSLGRAQPSAWKGSGGRLWFTTYGGIIGIDSLAARRVRPGPIVRVDDIRVDGISVGRESSLILSPAARRVEFRLVAPELWAPDRVRYRHRLDGFDPVWIESGADPSAAYSNLPPGDYRLEIAARDVDGPWIAAAAPAALQVQAPWWNTPWARLLWLLGFAAAVAAPANWWSRRQLRHDLARLQREQELHREKSRIARDLHDELGSALTRIGLLAHRARRSCTETDTASALDSLLRSVRRAACDLHGIVWAVKPQEEILPRLAAFLGRHAKRYLEGSGIACQIRIADDLPALPVRPDFQHHVIAALKEVLNNVLKHSGADTVTVDITFADGALTLVVRDNGCGFHAEPEALAGDGLANLRRRAAEMGGDLSLDSFPGNGTMVSLRARVDGRAPRRPGLPPEVPNDRFDA